MANKYLDIVGNKKPGEEETPYDLSVKDAHGDKSQQFQASINAAVNKDPDRMAEADKLAKELNLPVAVVEKDFDRFNKLKKSNETTYSDYVNKAPGVARYLQDPVNASISHDDLDKLVETELALKEAREEEPSFSEDLFKASKTGYHDMASSVYFLSAAFGMSDLDDTAELIAESVRKSNELRAASPDYVKEFDKVMEEEGRDVDEAVWDLYRLTVDENLDRSLLETAVQFTEGSGKVLGEIFDQWGAALARPKGLTYKNLETLANSAPSIATGIAGGFGGAQVGAFAGVSGGLPGIAAGATIGSVAGFGSGIFVGSAAIEIGAEIRSELSERGIDLTDPQQIAGALRDPTLMEDVKARALRKGLTTGAVDSMFATLTAGMSKLGKPVAGVTQVVKQEVKETGIDVFGEGFGEFSGQVAREKGDLSKVNIGESINESIISFGQSAVTSVAGGTIGVAREQKRKRTEKKIKEKFEQVKKAHKALKTARALEDAGEAVKNSKTLQRNPEKVKEMVQQTFPEGKEQSVYFQEKDWDAIWNGKGISPAQAAEDVGGESGALSYRESKATGSLIEFKVSDFIAKLAKEEFYNEILAVTRTTEDGSTVAESIDLFKNIPQDIEQLAKEAKEQIELDQKEQEQFDQVVTGFESQLRAAGESNPELKAQVMTGRFFKTMAKRAGLSIPEFMEKFPLRISRGEQALEGERVRVADQLEFERQSLEIKRQAGERITAEDEKKVRDLEEKLKTFDTRTFAQEGPAFEFRVEGETFQTEEEAKEFAETKQVTRTQVLESAEGPFIIDNELQGRLEFDTLEEAREFVRGIPRFKDSPIEEIDEQITAKDVPAEMQAGFDPVIQRVRKSQTTEAGAEISPLGFFSKLDDAIKGMEFKNIRPSDLKKRLVKTNKDGSVQRTKEGSIIPNVEGLKVEEIEFTGILEWLDMQEQDQKLSIEQVNDYIKQNGVVIEQIVLADEFDDEDRTIGIQDLKWSSEESLSIDEIRQDFDSGIDDTILEDARENVRSRLDEDEFVEDTGLQSIIDKVKADNPDLEGFRLDNKILEEIENELPKFFEQEEEFIAERIEAGESIFSLSQIKEEETGATLTWGPERGDDHFVLDFPSGNREDIKAGSLREATVIASSRLIEEGELEGDLSDLSSAEDIAWDHPKGEQPAYRTLKKRRDKIVEKDRDRLEAAVRERYANFYNNKERSAKEVQEEIQEDIENLAMDEAGEFYDNPDNARNTIRIKLQHPIVDGYIRGNNKKGWHLHASTSQIPDRVFKIEATDLDAVKQEAAKHLEEAGFVKPPAQPQPRNDGETYPDINDPVGTTNWKSSTVDGDVTKNYREILLTLPGLGRKNFSYTVHYPYKNYFAHIRLSDKVDDQGKKVLFIEELQSDWHQQGRRRDYDGQKFTAEDARRYFRIGQQAWDQLTDQEKSSMVEEMVKHLDKTPQADSRVPDAPFKDTEVWTSLAIKRLIRLAAEEGYDSIAISPGEIHSERWATNFVTWQKVEGRSDLEVVEVPDELEIIIRETAPDKPVEERQIIETFKVQSIDVYQGPELTPAELATAEGEIQVLLDQMQAELEIDDIRAREEVELRGKKYDAFELTRIRNGINDVLVDLGEDVPFSVAVGSLAQSRDMATFLGGEIVKAPNADIVQLKMQEAQRAVDKMKEDHFVVSGAEFVEDAEVEGLGNVAAAAERERLLRKQGGKRVSNTEELYGVLTSILSNDNNNRTIFFQSETLWKKMQEEPFGEKRPREEGLKFLYDRAIPQAMKKVVKKSSKVEKGVIKLDDPTEAEDGITVFKFDITDKLKKKALAGGFTLFQAGRRGQITFNGKTADLKLLENANASTFFHEMGHFYLEVMASLAEDPAAPQDIKDDFQTLLDWFGVSSRDEITREHHEKFAEGIETYFLEGKAPTTELQRAFNKFKAWLISVYGNLRRLVNLTPEVRDVMDRLFATDKEIQEAKDQFNMDDPLMTDPRTFGMSDEKARRFEEAREDAERQASETLVKKAMEARKKKQTAEYKKARKKIKEEVTDEINNEKLYIALAILQRGVMPDGSPLPEGIEPVKLNREGLVRDYGAEFVKNSLPKPFIYSRKGGVDYEYFANKMGYDSGDQMIQEMSVALPRKEAIERRTEQRMLEEFPDLIADPAEMEQAAINALHNEKRLEYMELQLQALAENNAPVLKEIIRRTTRRPPKKAQVKERARMFIANMKIRDIKPNKYRQAEARAAKEAGEALAKGDLDAAFQAKQREMFNAALYGEAVKARQAADKTVEYVKKFNKGTVRQKIGLAGGGFLEQIDAILERFDFRKGRTLKSIDRSKTLAEWVRDMADDQKAVDLPRFILDEARKTSWKELNPEQLEELDESLRTIEHLARFKSKLLGKKKRRDLRATVDELVAAAQANTDFVRKTRLEQLAEPKQGRIKGFLKEFFASHTKMEFLFESLDGDEAQGVWWTTLFKPIADAEDDASRRNRESTMILQELLEKYYPRKTRTRDLYIEKIHIPQLGIALPKAKLIAMGLNWGNVHNREALLEGYEWTDAQVNPTTGALSLLDENDWKMIQEIWDYLDTFREESFALDKRVFGVMPKRVEPDSFETKFGTFKGGYYPASYDPNFSDTQYLQDQRQKIMEAGIATWRKPQTKRGHLKERTGSAGKPIELSLNVLGDHISDVIHDLAYREAIINANTIISHPEVKEAIIGATNKETYEMVRIWLKSVAGERDQMQGLNQFERFVTSIKGGMAASVMGFKFTTGIVQFTGFSQSIDEIGLPAAMDGLAQFYGKGITNPKEAWEFVASRSEFMKNRAQTFDRDVKEMVRKEGLGEPDSEFDAVWRSMTPDMKISLFHHIGMMDMAVSVPTWLGAYNKAFNGNVSGVMKGNEEAAIAYADRTVRVTQGSGSVKDLARIQNGGALLKTFTMFYSFFSVLYQRFAKSFRAFRLSDSTAVGTAKLMQSMFWIWIAPAVVETMILGEPPEDDDEWAEWMIRKVLTYPSQVLIGVRDIVNLEEERFGYNPSPLYDFGKKLVGINDDIVDMATGKKELDEVTAKDVEDLINVIGVVFHLPTRQMILTGRYFIDWMAGEEDPEHIGEAFWRGFVKKDPNK